MATGTTLDDDVKVTVAVSPSPVNENSGTGMAYTFIRTGDPSLAATANFIYGGTTTDTGAKPHYTEAGVSTLASSVGAVIFAAGSPTATVTVTPIGDAIVEDDEAALLPITSGTGYGIGVPAAATGTITNDDTATLTLTGGIAYNEGNAGSTSYTFTATLNKAVQGGFTVAYTNNGTATAPSDYAGNGGTLTFTGSAGETQTITVPVNGDTAIDPDETFTVALGLSPPLRRADRRDLHGRFATDGHHPHQ